MQHLIHRCTPVLLAMKTRTTIWTVYESTTTFRNYPKKPVRTGDHARSSEFVVLPLKNEIVPQKCPPKETNLPLV